MPSAATPPLTQSAGARASLGPAPSRRARPRGPARHRAQVQATVAGQGHDRQPRDRTQRGSRCSGGRCDRASAAGTDVEHGAREPASPRAAARGARVAPRPARARARPTRACDQSVFGKASSRPVVPESAKTRRDAARARPGEAPAQAPLASRSAKARGSPAAEDLPRRRRVIVRDSSDSSRARGAVPDRVAGARIAIAQARPTLADG